MLFLPATIHTIQLQTVTQSGSPSTARRPRFWQRWTACSLFSVLVTYWNALGAFQVGPLGEIDTVFRDRLCLKYGTKNAELDCCQIRPRAGTLYKRKLDNSPDSLSGQWSPQYWLKGSTWPSPHPLSALSLTGPHLCSYCVNNSGHFLWPTISTDSFFHPYLVQVPMRS